MLSQANYNAFCSGLAGTSHHLLWGGHDVWKVGGKMFALGGFQPGETSAISFKCSDMSFELLKQEKGLRPAPYLAARGQPWIQHYDAPGLSDSDQKAYLKASWEIVARSLTKKAQRELGLIEE